MTTEQVPLDWDQRVEQFARCRAYILQAIHSQPGMTYIEIRKWIEEHKRFTMENVGAQVRELARTVTPVMARIEYDEHGKVHVYPITEQK